MLRNVLTSPGESASCVGLVGMAMAAPAMLEERFGVPLILVPGQWRWAFSWLAGLCAAIGLAQVGAILLDWRRARLWTARAAVAAAAGLVVMFVPLRFFGSVTAAAMLITINVLTAVRWELRASD